ncbi:hypothetical protein [Pseudaminobacter soli (ex Li et al. 2025)]|uniref:Uncharacterized protein n=1 Tax=Pseudaminobacter soli (ex Li et al. 2025) TaxID=1295366 RepID=A0A2P7RSP5_9HYPH|nr:hypothetical protein [Mesorhizobium soli]PSJ53223.1 hypothetical protein C7I85_28335 [Mesorhizobium soli]
MTDVVEDLRAMAANPGGYTKAEVIELLMKAADMIENDRTALAKARGGIIEAVGHLDKMTVKRTEESTRQLCSGQEGPKPGCG